MFGSSLSGQDEDARTNDGADTQGNQIQRAESPLQAMLAAFSGFRGNRVKRFYFEKIGHSVLLV